MTSSKEYKQEMYALRSVMLVGALKGDRDKDIAEVVGNFGSDLEFSGETRHHLLIDEGAWNYVVSLHYKPHSVFCHPDILLQIPRASLYYRGMTGLSLKAVQQLACAVKAWEEKDGFRLRSAEKARTVARLYNLFMSSIIKGANDWVLENGYRTILATMGISFDGMMRNKLGDIAEERVRQVLCDFIVEQELLDSGADLPDHGPYRLKNGISMHFSDDPDVYFTDAKGQAIATVEIKGGLDEAGGLERLGATQKSFLKAIQATAKCRTYFVSGVITRAMEERLRRDRNFDAHFSLVEILTSGSVRSEFLKEIFHHGLRFELKPTR